MGLIATDLFPLDLRCIVIVGGFFGVTHLSKIVTFLGLYSLEITFLDGVGAAFFGATGNLDDFVFAILIGVTTFFIGVNVPFFICFDYFSFGILAAGDLTFLISNFVASFSTTSTSTG